MKTLIKFVLAAILLVSTVATQAGPVRGYYRSNGTYVAPSFRSSYGSLGASAGSGYVYRNPYAAYPSVSVRGYYRSTGTYVAPHVRTPANNTVTDNLSYRGYPSQQPGYVSPRSHDLDSSCRPTPLPSYGSYNLHNLPRPSTGDYAPKPLWGNSRSSCWDF